MRSRELEQLLKEVSDELERSRTELLKERDERTLAEAELQQQLAEANADRQQVEARCRHCEEELAGLRRMADDLVAKVAGQEERAGELERRSADLENQLCLSQQKHSRVLADLDQERARLLHSGEQLQRAHELNERYEQHINQLNEANQMLLASQEELQTLLSTNLRNVQEKLFRLKGDVDQTSVPVRKNLAPQL
jgi:chromosome segregation ATPase